MKQLIITILIILGLVILLSINDFMWSVEAQVKEPEKPTETYSIAGEKMTAEKYQEVKLELKGKVGNRDKVKLSMDDANKWVEVVNLSLKDCRMLNVTTKNLIDSLNTCLK